MAHRHPVGAASAVDRAVMDREDHGLASPQGNDLTSRLSARALLDQEELAAGEVVLGGAEQHGKLQWKDQIAIEVLVQAVVVAGLVFEDERRWPLLARCMAFFEISGDRRRES